MKRYDLVCAGFACLDIMISGDIGNEIFSVDTTEVEGINFFPGGDAVNEAITASTLGLRTALVVGCGNDGKGDTLVRKLSHWDNLDLHVDRVEGDSLCSAVLVRRDGQRNFLFTRGLGDSYVAKDHAFEVVKDCRVLSLGSFFVQPLFDRESAPVLLRVAKEHGAITVADTCWPTIDGMIEDLDQSLPFLDYFMPSREEAERITGEHDLERIYKVFAKKGLKNLVVKLGARGCYIRTPEEAMEVSTFTNVPVVDTTGCGDSFVGGFCYGLIQGYSLEQCALFANGTASLHAGSLGGSGSIESDTMVSDFVTRHKDIITIRRSTPC